MFRGFYRGLCACWAFLSDERISAPAVVLLIHGALVADIFAFRPELWDDSSAEAQALRWLIVLTIILYIRTCCTEPGFVLAPLGEGGSFPGQATRGGWLSCVGCCCSAVAVAVWTAADKRVKKSGSGDSNDTGGSAALKKLEELSAAAEVGGSDAVELVEIVGNTADSDEEKGVQKRRGGPNEVSSVEGTVEYPPTQSGCELRWCRICNLYQPLRTKHCRDCGRCVRTHDHHCPWIGSCVGENNRSLFFVYLCSQACELAVGFVAGCQGISIIDPSVVLLGGLLVIALFFIMVMFLLSFHSFLVIANLTTWEHTSWNRITYLKGIPFATGSPFGRSEVWNMAAYFFGAKWCPSTLKRWPGLRYDEDNGILWEVAEYRPPCWLARCCNECC
eukprot:TRINITY_DN44763_c0_g1_i1.p1 TRINITY_DN44763_c0_g1~~TRINITY_DN44763_c0_g1_i1.p1  ORF type:complete len:390 (+),score=51.38 TRINITY_DN44763_c0_g1_i1:201-1370(+)